MPSFDHIDQPDPRDEVLERAPCRDRNTLAKDLTALFATRMPDLRSLSPSPAGAASQFIGLMEPPHEREKVQTVGVPGKRDATRTIDPYYDRVMHCAKRFMRLPEGQQSTIVANARTCPWRGDDLDTYVLILDETERMAEMGVEAYRAQALGQLRRIIAGGA